METETSEIIFVVRRKERNMDENERGVKEKWLFVNVRNLKPI